MTESNEGLTYTYPFFSKDAFLGNIPTIKHYFQEIPSYQRAKYLRKLIQEIEKGDLQIDGQFFVNLQETCYPLGHQSSNDESYPKCSDEECKVLFHKLFKQGEIQRCLNFLDSPSCAYVDFSLKEQLTEKATKKLNRQKQQAKRNKTLRNVGEIVGCILFVLLSPLISLLAATARGEDLDDNEKAFIDGFINLSIILIPILIIFGILGII